ncbi:hypothetical protein BJV82DRAFT_631776 [Fennellomyces sp. T-0311]|nr:hypothetical protein BJV82DRAFT_631776 [Fennellomyces sp. T-0311]
MASFASVNHPPFAYDPSCKPAKSILKQKSRLSRTSPSWLSTINSKLSSASMNFADNNPNIPSLITNNSEQQPELVQTQEPSPARSLGLLNIRKFINNANNDNHSITSTTSSTVQEHVLDSDELAPDELKRVRFSVKQLTTEYYPYRNPTPPPNEEQDESDEEPSTASSIDASELPENAAALLLSDNTDPQDAKLDKAALCDDKKKTPLELYEIACRNKEEMPLPAFVTNLNQCASLTKVDLSNQVMSRRVVEPIADVLGLGFDLQELVLSNCSLEDDALKVLLHTLLLNDTLRYLSLAENKKLKTAGFKYIAIYVKGSSHLEHLDLSMTSPDKKAMQYLAQALTAPASSSTKAPSLKRLLMDGCLLKPTSLEILASGVRKSPNLRHLSLANNRINNQGAVWLGVMLRDYDNPETIKGLEYLNLDSNDIRHSVQYIAQALRRNRSLATLSLRECKIDAKDCALIGEALKYNQALAKLNISSNNLSQPTSEGILAIKQALYVNWTLKELNMSAAGLTSEAAIYLAECLPENRALRRLDLSKNLGIDLAGLLALSASVRLNETLTFLDVNIPPSDREMAKIQGDIVAKCTKNAQSTPKDHEKKDQTPSSVRRVGSQSSLDPNAMATTAQATARLSLQERLAAVTRGKVSGPTVNKSPTPAENVKAAALQKPPRQTQKKPVVVDAEMVTTATTQVSLFEDMLAAEANQRDVVMDAVQAPEDVILQVYGQCRKSQTMISAHIPKITDDDELAQLLSLNDRLTAAISQYEQLFSSEAVTQKPTEEQRILSDESKLDETSVTSSFLLEGTEPPLSTSFEIGDVDEDDDDMIPMRHPSPGIESK